MLKKVSVIAEDFSLNADVLSDGDVAMINLRSISDGVEKEIIEVVASPEELRAMVEALTYILKSMECEHEIW